MNLRHLIYKLIKQSPFGYDDLANYINQGRDIKTSAQTLTNKFNPNSDTHLPNICECEQALDLLNGWPALADYAAGKCGAVVVPLPADDEFAGDMSLLDGFMEVAEAHGEFAKQFKEVIADGRVTAAEFEQLQTVNRLTISRILSSEADIARLVR